jgi:hypothetical protein
LDEESKKPEKPEKVPTRNERLTPEALRAQGIIVLKPSGKGYGLLAAPKPLTKPTPE